MWEGLFAGSISKEAKNFYTLGTVASSIVLPMVAGSVWAILRKLFPVTFSPVIWPFLLSGIVTLLAAKVIPEPEGYRDAGKLRLTPAEIIYGVFMSLILGASIVGVDRWLTSAC